MVARELCPVQFLKSTVYILGISAQTVTLFRFREKTDNGLKRQTQECWNPIDRISYDSVTIILRQCLSYDRLTTDV